MIADGFSLKAQTGEREDYFAEICDSGGFHFTLQRV